MIGIESGNGGRASKKNGGRRATDDGGKEKEEGGEVGDGFNVARAFLHGRGPNRVRADGPLDSALDGEEERERRALWRRRWPRADAARGKKNVSKGASSQPYH